MGFDANWISPIPENYGNDYHGYAALDWYKVNPNFGNEQDLKNMIKAAQTMRFRVMLEVVANHVAYIDTDYYKVTLLTIHLTIMLNARLKTGTT